MAGNNGQRDNSFRGVDYKTLAAIASGGAEALKMEIAASGHRDVVPGVRSEEEAEALRATMTTRSRTVSASAPVAGGIRRGKIMVHVPTGKKVTIIQASAGRSKSGTVMHEVIDKAGKKFLAKENNLKSTNR